MTGIAPAAMAEDSAESRKQRLIDRVRQVLVELDREPAGLPWGELWARVEAAWPQVADDKAPIGRGETRGQNNLHWYMVSLDKAGWVLTGVGNHRITKTGHQALTEYPNSEELFAAAEERSKMWERLKKESSPPPGPAPDGGWQGIAPNRVGEVEMLAAARTLLESGLWVGGSAFDPGRRVWTADNVGQLHAAFVGNPDLGSRSFIDKLRDQLTAVGDDVILLAAEMLSLLLLPADDIKPETKRTRIKEVLPMMAEPVHIPIETSAAMEHGVFGAGFVLRTLIWRSFSTVIEVVRAWWARDDAARDRAWEDPWAWRDLVDSADGDTIPGARAELCYLMHPRTFPGIVNKDDRERIRKAFADVADGLTGDLERDLYAITMALQEQVGPGKVDFYRDPWLTRWRPSSPEPTGRRAWLVRSTQSGVLLLARWQGEECVSVQATHLPALEAGADTQAVRAAVDAGYQHVDYAQRSALANEYFDFLSRMKKGDIVATIANDNLYAGEVAGEAEYRPGGEPILRRSVSWQAGVPKSGLDAAVTSLLNRQGAVVDITAGFDALSALLPVEVDEVVDTEGDEIEPTPPPTDMVPVLPAVNAELAASLHMPEPPLQEIVDLLQTRQQIVLYGPPGTGKTYLAKKLAEYLVGDDPSRAQLVQFHPSYAYEDFFEGYRPVSDGGQATFELKPGPLRLIAGEATENREAPFILIIDEMNRANLAKVFGELYFLLEYRDESMRLQYQPTEAFKLPKNLFIIGTMNTADRSIALVDAAIRRRFDFVELHPDTEPVQGVLASFLAANGHGGERADLLAALNAEIEDHDRDLRIGPSYLMKADAATPGGLERIWKYEILPLLEEHYYGRLTRDEVHAKFGLEALRASLTPPAE